jgi:predicted DNA-binding protein
MSTFSLRMAEEDYEALQAMALLTGQPMAALVRAAIDETVRRFAQATRHDQVQAEVARRRNAMAILAGRAPGGPATALLAFPDRP